jgi:hypothetical protein
MTIALHWPDEHRPKALSGDTPAISKSGPICDYRTGCALIADLFPGKATEACQIIASRSHLAEALSDLGFCGKAAIDMALAVQEARLDPTLPCACIHGYCPAVCSRR